MSNMQAEMACAPDVAPAEPRAKPQKSPFQRERVLDVTHYTDKLFSFRTTRAPAFRFQSGQFTMIGLEVDGKPLMRAYSMASAYYDEHLEFFSIKVPDGPLTSRLQNIAVGDEVLVGPKPTGTLLLTNLEPGRRLFLFATGTGFAPFASLLRDPELYDRFDEVIVVNGCRHIAELKYAARVLMEVREHEYLAELVEGRLQYYATVTREPFYHQGRITDLIETGTLFDHLSTSPLDPAGDRVMICGNPNMLVDLKTMLETRGFEEGSSGKPSAFVIERAFAER